MEIFDRDFNSDVQTKNRILLLHEEWICHLSPNARTQHISRLVGWIPPMEDAIKIDVNRSSLGNLSHASCSDLVKDSSDRWLGGFYCFIGVASNLFTKLMAILHDPRLAWNMECDSVVSESDSLEALRIIKEENGDYHHHVGIVHNIRYLLH